MVTKNAFAADVTETADPFEPSLIVQLLSSPAAWRYFCAIIMTGVAATVAVAVDTQIKFPFLSLVFVIPVITAAVKVGFGPSLCAAILGALAYNFFLTEPRYSLAVDDPENIWLARSRHPGLLGPASWRGAG